MNYLLDVNALVAFALNPHEFHTRVTTWLKTRITPTLVSSSITELGFVRVLSQAPAYGFTVREACGLLLRVKQINSFHFLPDDLDISRLPAWVKYPRQTTDGHLVALAKAHGAILATLDEKIPSAELIP